MGHLLSSAIKMQGAANEPTLTATMNDLTGDGYMEVYKNGVLYTTIIGSATQIIPVVAGNTFYVRVYGFGGNIAWFLLLNGVYTGGAGNAGPSITSTTYTISGTNAYGINGQSDVP
jgi:hypothetical protein